MKAKVLSLNYSVLILPYAKELNCSEMFQNSQRYLKNIIEYIAHMESHDIESNSAFARLAGDASDRKFFRIKDSQEHTYVLMMYTESFTRESFPYLIQYYLFGELSLPVAEVMHINEQKGWILLEDLGDVTLQRYLEYCTAKNKKQHYLNAIELLFTFHTIKEQICKSHPLAFQLAFDTQKLFDELLFFYNNFICSFLEKELSIRDEALLKKGFYEIAHYLSERSRILCHRDYHSRNIMIKDERLYLIDFQDARMGPKTYDIISLLRDSYVDIDEAFREEMLNYYITGAHLIRDAELEKELLYMSLQRNIKATGTFANQYCVKAKELYVEFIPRTIRYIIDKLSLLEEMKQ